LTLSSRELSGETLTAGSAALAAVTMASETSCAMLLSFSASAPFFITISTASSLPVTNSA
jgi:hypothetical protein